VRTVRRLGGRAVRGNHEDRLLRLRREGPARALAAPAQHLRACLAALTPEELDWLASLPLWLDLPAHGARVVHAGVMPGIPIEDQSARTLLYIRSLGGGGVPMELRGEQSWAQSYHGHLHVVFGHNAQLEPEIAPRATGIDTGVVYGGRLTAMVLREGERPPPADERRSVLVSVPARRVYYEKLPRPAGADVELSARPSPFLRRAS
jgi:diadenosine tetraphosphatase ApaH/serine/threonine PP2A family protein phosphatase